VEGFFTHLISYLVSKPYLKGEAELFKGEYQHNIDDKGRFIIPSKLRDGLGSSFVLTRGLDGCLFAYTVAGWGNLEKDLRRLSFTKADARAFSRQFLSGANDIDVDKQFRVLIPPTLREHAGLEKDIVILGVGSRVEIWDKNRWEKYYSKSSSEYESVAEKLIDFDCDFDLED